MIYTNALKLPVGIWVGMTIATIGLKVPVFAFPQPSSLLVAQTACVVSKQTPVFRTANPDDSEALSIRPLSVGTAVVFAAPLPPNPPARVPIKPRGFVDFAALDCGDSSTVVPPPSQSTSVCRTVRDSVPLKYVFAETDGQSRILAPVSAKMEVWVTRTAGGGVTHKNTDGVDWVQVDLQRTFSKNFGIASGFGWLSNTDPGEQLSTLVNSVCK